MKPIIFNESIEEVKESILDEMEKVNLNNPEQCIYFGMGFDKYFKSPKCFAKYNFEKRELLLCMDPVYYGEGIYYKLFTEDYIALGTVAFKGRENELGEFVTDDLDIKVFDSEDIKGFERVRLRLLFEEQPK